MNGNWLLTSSRDQLAKLFDIRTMKELQVFRGHRREVTSCQWHPFHEGLFMTGSGDGSINFYHVGGSENPIAKIDGAHDQSIWDVAWHPFGHSVASISNDQLLRFWTRNRPGDRFDDKHNLTARQEANVDPTKCVRAASNDGAQAASEAAQMPSLASAFLADASSAVIPGMSSTQAKMRRMRPQSIAPSRPGATPTVELRVLSYDILAQVNAATRNFPDATEAMLAWPYRSQNLLLEIRQRNSDVLCLQEVSFYKEFWQQNLKGYQAVYQPHPDANSAKCVVVLTRPSKVFSPPFFFVQYYCDCLFLFFFFPFFFPSSHFAR